MLARALYKHPKILFLDEAMSHLALEREQAVNASIKALNMTRIIVAHRPETIASADRVIALREGRIVDETPTFATSSAGRIIELRNRAATQQDPHSQCACQSALEPLASA